MIFPICSFFAPLTINCGQDVSLEIRRSMLFRQGEEYKLRANHTKPTTPTSGNLSPAERAENDELHLNSYAFARQSGLRRMPFVELQSFSFMHDSNRAGDPDDRPPRGV
jgi:hypothetical protein